MIGTYFTLGMAPEMVQCIEFWAALRQPDQADAEISGQSLRLVSRVTGVLVQQQRDLPAAVMLVDDLKERLEVSATLVVPGQEQPVPCLHVDGAENDAPSVAARQRDLGRLAATRPTGTQRWEEQQVGFVLEEQSGAWSQVLYLFADTSHLASAVGVGLEYVAWPLPDIMQAMQLPA